MTPAAQSGRVGRAGKRKALIHAVRVLWMETAMQSARST